MLVQYFNITRFIDASESFQWDVTSRAMRVRNVVTVGLGRAKLKTECNSTGC